MRRLIPATIGAAAAGAGAMALRQHRDRALAQRLSAATLETLLDAIEANDAVTGRHVRRVAAFSLILADAADLDERTKRSIERIALFHDIGKLHQALTDIFHDASKLTPEEWRAVRTHPQRGADVLAPLAAFYPDLAKGVAAHHERWDGSGYPRGLKGNRIPLTARVVSIADTFDAITHQRRYSAGRSFATAMAVIAEGRGTQFDPDLVDLFISPPIAEEIEQAMRKANGPQTRRMNRRAREVHRAPDITFRWRTRTGASHSRDRQS